MELLKVTGASRTVTDPVLLGALAGQGIDKDGVEFVHDYALPSKEKGCSPYINIYRDLNSGKRFIVCSRLPMVDAYGQRHENEWRDNHGSIENGNNIFHAIVKEGTVRLVALSDQPNGVKKDGETVFHPRLFIGGSEIRPVSDVPRLLETDPANDNYHNNVLEWDYGICKRRLRLLEGRFLGTLGISQRLRKLKSPSSINGRAAMKLRLSHARTDDEEFVPQEYFNGKKYPVVIADSATFLSGCQPGNFHG